MNESFAERQARYLAGLPPALAQLGFPDLQALSQTLETYHQAATQHLASSWPNFPQAAMQPIHALHRDFPLDPAIAPDLLSITRQRPQPNEVWEQLPCEPASAQSRLLKMRPHLQPGQTCLLLGDDDLLSLYLQNEGLELTVLDIDERLLEFLKDHGYRGKLLHQDLTHSHPQEKYDLVITDPPWAHQGMQTFLNAALTALKPGGQLWLSTQPEMLESRSLFEARLSSLQLQQSWPHLNRYAYPESMLEEVLFQLARYDFEPEPSALIFGTPCLFADFFLYRQI